MQLNSFGRASCREAGGHAIRNGMPKLISKASEFGFNPSAVIFMG